MANPDVGVVARAFAKCANRAGTALRAYAQSYEDGITASIFAIAILVLLGMVALGVDGGRIYDERRAAQNAADHAAIAAALESCTTSDADLVAAANTAGIASAAQNGYDDVPINEVTITHVGATGTHLYSAQIDTEIPTTFGQIIGFSELATNASATAEATGCDASGGAGPGAIFAGGTNCTDPSKPGFDSPGSDQLVVGGVHTNATARVGGGGNDFTEVGAPDDPFTYVDSLASGSTGNGNVYQAGYPLDEGPTTQPWPTGFDTSVITGSGDPPGAGTWLRAYYDLADANGTTSTNDTLFTDKVTAITKNGVYYTTHADGMDIGSITAGVTEFVLIAPNGPIKVAGGTDNRTFNPYDHASMPMDGLLMMSKKTYSSSENCDKFTIALSGSNTSWNGLLWAPGGMVEFSGSVNSSVNGSVIGWAVRLNGSHLTIRYDSTLFPDDEPDVLLID